MSGSSSAGDSLPRHKPFPILSIDASSAAELACASETNVPPILPMQLRGTAMQLDEIADLEGNKRGSSRSATRHLGRLFISWAS